MSLVSIIIPVCNESMNILPLYKEIQLVLTDQQFELVWIDDGSTDSTLAEITSIANTDTRAGCISLSRNFGHQNAIVAGLKHCKGDLIIIMDGDLQHPPSMIPAMIDKINDGYDIVFTRNLKKDKAGWFKKQFSTAYYKIINLISDVRIHEDSADFKAFTPKVLKAVLSVEERELFLRGIFSWAGFRNTTLNFNAPVRLHGSTKYSVSKMFDFGFKGITSFWVKPLRIALWMGFIICLASFLLCIWAVVEHFKGHTIRGWTSLIIAVVFFGGVQLFFLGLLGEYIGSIFIEVKNRPLYIIDKKINLD